jgi:hypothetical protein
MTKSESHDGRIAFITFIITLQLSSIDYITPRMQLHFFLFNAEMRTEQTGLTLVATLRAQQKIPKPTGSDRPW